MTIQKHGPSLTDIGRMKLKEFFANLPVHWDAEGYPVVTLNGVEYRWGTRQ